MPEQYSYEALSAALQKGRAKLVKEEVQKAADSGQSASDILDHGMLPAMSEVGERFSSGAIFVPEVLMAAKAMNAGMDLLKPMLTAQHAESKGRVCIGTIKGDQHDIGKNLVKMMMEGAGLEVLDLGVNVPAKKFAETALEKDCQVIACSALLTTTMNGMAQIVTACEELGIRDRVRIMVGGAPVTEEFCVRIGADRYTADAASAARAAVELCSQVQGA